METRLAAKKKIETKQIQNSEGPTASGHIRGDSRGVRKSQTIDGMGSVGDTRSVRQSHSLSNLNTFRGFQENSRIENSLEQVIRSGCEDNSRNIDNNSLKSIRNDDNAGGRDRDSQSNKTSKSKTNYMQINRDRVSNSRKADKSKTNKSYLSKQTLKDIEEIEEEILKEIEATHQEKVKILKERLQRRKEASTTLSQDKSSTTSSTLEEFVEENASDKVKNWIETNRDYDCNKNINKSLKENNNVSFSSTLEDNLQKIMLRQTIDTNLPIFSGNVKEWPTFINRFQYTTDQLKISNQENIDRLNKCLIGDARRAVQGLLMCNSVSVDEILKILEQRFGRTDLIVKTLTQEAKNLPQIKIIDQSNLINFAEVVANLALTLESLNMQNHLNSPELLELLVHKLPYNMQFSWGEKMARQPYLSLLDFKDWIWEKSVASTFAVASTSRAQNFQNSNQNRTKPNTTLVISQDRNKNIECDFCKQVHKLEQCKDFLDLSIVDRWKFVKEKRLCFSCLRLHKIKDCRAKTECCKNECKKNHHQILHFDQNKETDDKQDRQDADTMSQANSNSQLKTNESIETALSIYPQNSKVFLKILPVIIKNGNKEIEINCLLDEGSSITLIDEDLANSLGLRGQETSLNLRWADKNTSKSLTTQQISFTIRGKDMGDIYDINAYTIQDLDLPTQYIDVKKAKSKWIHFSEVDVSSYPNIQPKLLIGQDHWDLITTRKIVEGPKNSPALSYTKLGWVIHGKVNEFNGRLDIARLNFIYNQKDQELHDLIENYFTTENFGLKIDETKIETNEDKKAQDMIASITRRKDDRWETGHLWKDQEKLPNSLYLAEQRLNYICKKRQKNDEFDKQYEAKLEEYLEKGYARKLSGDELQSSYPKIWYLPHFSVTNPNKPGKFRFVFDAAAKVQGTSLNDFLMKGPDLYNSLVGILFKFREHPIAFSADIREMFHQILIREEDQHGQRFLWKNQKGEIEVYAMNVMIFGAVSSPYSAQYVKNLNALEYQNEYPTAVEAIVHKHYMDDYLDSVTTQSEAKKLIKEVIEIHKRGGFELRGWICNNEQVFNSIPENLRTKNMIFDNPDASERVLGLTWNPNKDVLKFPLNLHKANPKVLYDDKIPTKREMLQIIMSVYDPLGLLGNLTVQAKILMQDVWISKITWDEEILENQYKKWKIWLKNLEKVKTLEIERCYSLSFKIENLELHVFCDASQQAFSTVAYFRFVGNTDIKVSLVMSKNKVAPVKKISIPRLELQAALMASRLAKNIHREHSVNINKSFFWTDSTTVIHWLKTNKKLPTFVNNRINEIKNLFGVEHWRWISTDLNIADEATRDGKIDINKDSLWYRGPTFLYLNQAFWPGEEITEEKDKMENIEGTINMIVLNLNEALPSIQKFSKLTKLLFSTAYVLKFVKILKKTIQSKSIENEDIKEAEKIWLQKVQAEMFPNELRKLENGKPVLEESKIFSLSPCLYQNLICVSGRVDNSPELVMETKRPIILEGRHHFTKLLILDCHLRNAHANVHFILNKLKQSYYIIRARRTITAIVKNCAYCKIMKAKPIMPEMGQLPKERLQRPNRPFTFVGIDYFGPLEVTIGRRREKRYGVLFTCLSIRAVHLEIAETLNTNSTIMAIRRFISRRGQPEKIFSDNGTNLTAADKELKSALSGIQDEEIKKYCLAQRIDWKFIPPASPHMGGSWESLVKSVKRTIKIILKEVHPKNEVLHTVFCEAEHLVNSRPLTYVSSDDNLESLTPNHFLMGSSSCNAKPISIFENKLDLREQWKITQQLSDRFWRRWITEFIPTLIRRNKWLQKNKNVQIDDVVVVVDNQLPRNNWPLGKVEKVYPGKDGKVRVVDVRTKYGSYRRPVAKICPVECLERGGEEW